MHHPSPVTHDIQHATMVWGLLVGMTLCSFYLSTQLAGLRLMSAILTLAILKAAWIAFDYMGLRRTQLGWRLAMGLWLAMVASAIALSCFLPG